MATRGQTHNKRARELALKEKRERKQAKKDDRRAGIYPSAEYGETELSEENGDADPSEENEEATPDDDEATPDNDEEQPDADEEPGE